MAVDDHNHYKALLRRGQEPCDFCDRTFKNRFDSIIHNASHIIIPLMKQNWLQCYVCLYYFPSQEDLDDHHSTKHPNIEISRPNVNIQCCTKIKIENSDEYDKSNSVVEMHDDFKNTTRHLNVASDMIKHENDTYDRKENNRRNSLEIKKEAIKVESVDYDNGIVDLDENDYKTLSNGNTESIKSRLRFEDDDLFDGNGVLSDLVTECKVKAFNEPINQVPGFTKSPNNINYTNNDNKKGLSIRNTPLQTLINEMIKSNFHRESIHNGNVELNKTKNNLVTDDYEYDNFVPKEAELNAYNVQNIDRNNGPEEPQSVYKSVHYSDLTKPGIFSCKFCSKVFPNRLVLIQHEPKHMHFKRPRPRLCTYCDKYIAGSHVHLHRHITREHPGAPVDKKHKTHKCPKCSLKFRRYMTHVRNYHRYDCKGCGKEYSENLIEELDQHSKTCTTQNILSKIINVCELCFSFFKVKMNLKYTLMGTTVNELGVRYPCAVCGKKYFELKMIKRESLHRGSLDGNTVNGRCDYKRDYKYKSKRPLTNEERLKKFQHRLKQINLLNKFYFGVLLLSFLGAVQILRKQIYYNYLPPHPPCQQK